MSNEPPFAEQLTALETFLVDRFLRRAPGPRPIQHPFVVIADSLDDWTRAFHHCAVAARSSLNQVRTRSEAMVDAACARAAAIP